MKKAIAILTALMTSSAVFAATPYEVCEHTVGTSRSDHGSETYHTTTVLGQRGDTFTYSGCSTAYVHGQQCVNQYGVSAGARLLVNQDNKIVAEGNCCNAVVNKVTSVKSECHIRINSTHNVE